jgi:hypothetical protein
MVRLNTNLSKDGQFIPQTSTLTESAYGPLLERQEQLRAETIAIINRKHNSRKFWQRVENVLICAVLLAMLSMGAWLGPASKLVLQLLGVTE